MKNKLNKIISKISKNITKLSLFFLISFISVNKILATGETPPPNDAMASGAEKLGNFAGKAGINQYQNPISVIIGIINFALGFLGLLFLILIIMGGFKWMTSAGEDEKINKAKATIKSATIGLFIVFASWIISASILMLFQEKTGGHSNWLQGSWGWW